jgi:hypothetical protein
MKARRTVAFAAMALSTIGLAGCSAVGGVSDAASPVATSGTVHSSTRPTDSASTPASPQTPPVPTATTPPPTGPADPQVSTTQRAIDACTDYAAAHHDGVVTASGTDYEPITAADGSPTFDLPITTPEGTPAYYLCEIPGYPESFTVTETGLHDAN